MELVTLRQWFARPEWLWLLLLLPALVVLTLIAWKRRRRALARLGGGLAFAGAVSPRSPLRHVRRVCLALGLFLLILGAAGPQWGRDWSQSIATGRDVVVVLDCSRSMFAEQPSRLDRARAMIHHLVDALQARGGHRVALVVFAGRAKVACPLTHDYDHFRNVLDGYERGHFDPDLAAPEDGSSGTRMGLALAIAAQAHDGRYPGVQDVVFVSDGDDPRIKDLDDEWRLGVDVAQRRRIPVQVVGVGDPDTAQTIPANDEPFRYGDSEVRTQLEEKTLRQIAELTKGDYVPANTRELPLGEILVDRLSAGPEREVSEDALPLYRQRYPWFLGPALALLTLAMVIPDAWPRRRP